MHSEDFNIHDYNTTIKRSPFLEQLLEKDINHNQYFTGLFNIWRNNLRSRVVSRVQVHLNSTLDANNVTEQESRKLLSSMYINPLLASLNKQYLFEDDHNMKNEYCLKTYSLLVSF